jgi:hypothetical protein
MWCEESAGERRGVSPPVRRGPGKLGRGLKQRSYVLSFADGMNRVR